jgi:bis(5'-nucleosidyl)-tetraphosphatase
MHARAATRYARAGFRPLTAVHEALVLAAEAARAAAALPPRLDELEDLSCGVALVHADSSRVLLIEQRTHTGSHWALPKGHPEAGESRAEAALRELEEECGVRVAPAQLVRGAAAASRYSICGRLWGAAWFVLAVLPAGAPLPACAAQEAEVLACAWLPLAEGLARLTFDEERNALAALLARLA